LFPKTEAILRSQGLWQNRVRMKRYRPALWQGRSEDAVTLSYATSLGLKVMSNLKPLDYDLGLTSAESLVVRRDVLEQPAIQGLLSILRHRCELLVEQFPDLRIGVEG